MNKKVGNASIKFTNPVSIQNTATIVGDKEGEGPLSKYFDRVAKDMYFGQETWEQAEIQLVKESIELLFDKTGVSSQEIDYIVVGDLLNQSTSSTFGIKDFSIPLLGIYSACSNIGEAMSIGGILIDGGYAKRIIVSSSSHFSSAEKQFRSPLELATQRPPTSSWTVTGNGCYLLDDSREGPFITSMTTGKIIDMGITDAFNMGAAMAPAAADTIFNHFKDFDKTPDDYDVIVTGDLGRYGKKLLINLMKEQGFDIDGKLEDCGDEIYFESQDTHAGGSGAGCPSSVFGAYYYDLLKTKKINNMLFVPTGALLSSISVLQKLSIPGIAHAVEISNNFKG